MDPVLTHFMALRSVELLARRGTAEDRKVAAAELARVVDFYERGRAVWYLTQVRARADEWHVAFPAGRRTTGPRSLTRREREIAALIAQGMTNRQIAERLTLSIRTAESHVDQIRSKLGFKTRAQIATWVAQAPARR